ncbi:unnamed protein product [[Candida] boidinii]|uniref:Unnamed protein product n=1 Tax=Candida boidinii TaxID=5477 RepID=A0A9W6T1N0_CANBO|nr:hypothetical protein B5S30_g2275 [[Candida] boidinii]GME71437.1 unnamed protein product [[Candida] boidinii]GMG05109.1 unnamed protein product [[Candida] boidinii]
MTQLEDPQISQVPQRSQDLEAEHASVYKELVDVIDELTIETNKHVLNDKNKLNNNLISEIQTFINEISRDDGDGNNDDEDENENEETDTVSVLNKLINLRKLIIEQHYITYPILRSIHGNSGLVNKERELVNYIDDRDKISFEFVSKFKVLAKHYNHNDDDDDDDYNNNNSNTNNKELNIMLNDLNNELNQIIELNKEIKFNKMLQKDENLSINLNEEIEKLRFKIKLMKKRCLLMSDFTLNLISSLNISFSNDFFLQKLILYCGDYEDYLSDESSSEDDIDSDSEDDEDDEDDE